MLKLNRLKMKINFLKFTSLLLITGLTLGSCHKISDSIADETDSFGNLEIPDGFTWSTLNKSVIKVTITDAGGNPTSALNGFPLDVEDFQGNRLIRTSVIDGETEFYLELNNAVEQVKLVAPSLDKEQTITLGQESYNFQVSGTSSKTGYTDTDQDGVYDAFDDFPNDANLAYTISYPSPYQEEETTTKSLKRGFSLWYYQIYEDLWPAKGDYDFNDLTLKIKMVVNTSSSNKWVSGRFDIYVWTNGAAIDLGCGIDFYKYNGTRSGKQIHEYMADGTISLVGGTYDVAHTKMDTEAENAIIIFENADDIKPVDYWNTGAGLSYNPMASFMSFEWNSSNPQTMRAYTYLFYTDDRGHEIRTINLPPTEGMNMALLGTGVDNSPTTWDWTPGNTFEIPADNPFFVTSDLHPWGIEIEWSGDLTVPAEYVSVLDAFPEFRAWAESGGQTNSNWYRHPSSNTNLVFDVGDLVE